jgi:hypothetical protein
VTEPDVTLSDYALFVECALFAGLIANQPARRTTLRRWMWLFFGFTGAAALLGGTVHGFFAEGGTLGRALWKGSLLAIGGGALAALAMGAYLLFRARRARLVVAAAAALAAVYAIVILLINDDFWVAVAGYLPAAVVLLGAFASQGRDAGRPWARLGVLGLLLTVVAAGVQQLRVALHPIYFTHNTLYHVIQGVALAMIFAACRRLLAFEGDLHVDTT